MITPNWEVLVLVLNLILLYLVLYLERSGCLSSPPYAVLPSSPLQPIHAPMASEDPLPLSLSYNAGVTLESDPLRILSGS